jgi:uncharacterized membrane protein YkvI
MTGEWKKSLKAAGVFVSVILGAGFASGQEMMKFFIRHGRAGFLGLGVSGALMGAACWAVLYIRASEQAIGPDNFLRAVLGAKMGKIMDAVVTVFIAVLYCAMLSGVGALAREGFGLPFAAGAAALSAVCFIVFLTGIDGVVALNAFLAPLLLLGGVALGLYGVITETAPAFAAGRVLKAGGSWGAGAVVYASYNIITAVNILSGMDGGRKTAFRAGALGGISITVLGLCFAVPLYLSYDRLKYAQLPMLKLVEGYGMPVIKYLYVFVLCGAILTTAVSNGYAVAGWAERRLGAGKVLSAAAVTAGGCVLAHAGLSNIVGKVYPVFGYIGMFEMFAIIIYALRLRFAIKRGIRAKAAAGDGIKTRVRG